MRIGSVRGNDELEVSLVPLIDVVLTLIIFFVVTTTFQDRSALKIDLPEAQPDAVEALLRAHGIHGPIYRVSPNDPAALQSLKAVLLGVDATAKECLS